MGEIVVITEVELGARIIKMLADGWSVHLQPDFNMTEDEVLDWRENSLQQYCGEDCWFPADITKCQDDNQEGSVSICLVTCPVAHLKTVFLVEDDSKSPQASALITTYLYPRTDWEIERDNERRASLKAGTHHEE